MSDVAPDPEAATALAAEAAREAQVRRAEHRLALLEELTEIGMRLARRLETQAATSDPAAGDAADTFNGLSRAIRLTAALAEKVDVNLTDLKLGVVKTREEERAKAEKRTRERIEKAREDRVERVRELVLNVAESEHENYDVIDKIYEALDVRLEEDEPIFGSPDQPLRAMVERLCKDLDLNPDWSRWKGDGWIVDDPLSQRRASSLKRFRLAPGANAFIPATFAPLAPEPNAHVLE
jgi:hypothetical protein